MRIIDQNGCDYPYESIAISYGDGIIYARPISNMDKRYLIAQYSTQEKAEKAMQNVSLPEDMAEQLKNMTTGFICVNNREDNVRIEPLHMVFRFPQEDEI